MTDHTHFGHPSHHATGRPGGGRHGGSHHGWGRHGPFHGSDAPSFSRKLSAEDLQRVLLALLAQKPAHGYELIRMLAERSGGFYTPSSGMVYPALASLDEIGLTTSAPDANRKLHTITEAGRAYLAQQQEAADAILDALARIGGRMSEVRDAFSGVAESETAGSEELHVARAALKRALRQQAGCSAEEARRIAAILTQATASILAIGQGGAA